MHDEGFQDWGDGFYEAWINGTMPLPVFILQEYKRLGLSDLEAMLLIHILAFQAHEKKDFPSIDEIQERMSAEPEAVMHALEKLFKRDILTIDEWTDETTRMQGEKYNLKPLFYLWAAFRKQELDEMSSTENMTHQESAAGIEIVDDDPESNLFTLFEKEFGRALSPMECETIANWIDQDAYPTELIREALKEAVFAGKIHFRYIDRILLEWGRQRIKTPQEAREYAKKFRR